MSKKNKAKFKKFIQSQIKHEQSQTLAEPVKVSPQIETEKPATLPNLPNSSLDLSQIRYDLKKTALVVGVFVLILITLAYLNQKDGLLTTFGNYLFKTFHLNQ